MKSLSERGKAGRPKRATDCGTAISITLTFSAEVGWIGATGVSLALAGSWPKSVSSTPASVAASMSPTTTTRRLSLAKVRDQ